MRFVRGEEFTDIRSYAAPDVLRGFMGFGGTPEESTEGPMLQMLSGGFTQSVRMCLDAIGFADADIVPTQEVAVASATIGETPIGPIEPGRPGRRPRAASRGEAVVDDRHRSWSGVAVNWLMGEEHLDPPWTLGPEGQRYEVEVQGDPDTFAVIHGWHPTSIEAGLERNPGIVVTAAHCVNSIPYVVAAEPGIRTYLDLPLVAGRAHPDLARRPG